jgi:hypothetical protein
MAIIVQKVHNIKICYAIFLPSQELYLNNILLLLVHITYIIFSSLSVQVIKGLLGCIVSPLQKILGSHFSMK